MITLVVRTIAVRESAEFNSKIIASCLVSFEVPRNLECNEIPNNVDFKLSNNYSSYRGRNIAIPFCQLFQNCKFEYHLLTKIIRMNTLSNNYLSFGLELSVNNNLSSSNVQF